MSRRRNSLDFKSFLIVLIVSAGVMYWFITDFAPHALEQMQENAKNFKVG